MTWRDRQRHRQMTGTPSSPWGCNCLKISFVVNVKIKKYIYIYILIERNVSSRIRPIFKSACFNIATCQVQTSCFPWESQKRKTKTSVQIYSYPFWCFSFLSPNSADKHSRHASTAYRQMAWIGKLWTKSYRGNLTWHHKHSMMHDLDVITLYTRHTACRSQEPVLEGYLISFKFQRKWNRKL